ncbi:MAG: hypothetical protein QOD48_300 [Gaiellaceae bacterium]|jgi:hypothetical protein|nr:hypothetical protein [Gaiellaceae bacterium]
MASSKRQTTMAKMMREQAVRERRARKQEKKDERKQAALEQTANPDADADAEHTVPTEPAEDE